MYKLKISLCDHESHIYNRFTTFPWTLCIYTNLKSIQRLQEMLNLIKDELCKNSMSVNFILFHLQQPTPFTRVTYVNTEGQTTQPTPFTRVTYVNTERQASVLQINSLQYFNFLMRKVKWSWGTCLWVKFYPWTFIFLFS